MLDLKRELGKVPFSVFMKIKKHEIPCYFKNKLYLCTVLRAELALQGSEGVG